jgi:hypothetical protein
MAYLSRGTTMNRLHINIKDDRKTSIVLNLLRELPFVEIEGDTEKVAGESVRKGRGNLADLFGIWENRNISLKDIREKAWGRI